jgi:hypothetical protein
MYLRRFARTAKGNTATIVGAPVGDLSATFTTSVRNVATMRDFNWGTDPAGVPHHLMETLMTRIESSATPAFNAVLDGDNAYALTRHWPPAPGHRTRLSWWIAAQILRTKRQRHRLGQLNESEADIKFPPSVHKFAKHNPHLLFVASHLAPLAEIIYRKPWGLGFSNACLPTSDVPVIVMNGQDDADQLLAADHWDVLLPLDPHRFLLLPTVGSQEDPGTWQDHRIHLPGMLGVFIASLIVGAADTHVFHHPDHPPPVWDDIAVTGGRLPQPWHDDSDRDAPSAIVQYSALGSDQTVERRWLTEHPPRTD